MHGRLKVNVASASQRIRLLAEFLAAINKSIQDAASHEEPNYLPPETVASITAYLKDQAVENLDLHALRGTPWKYTHLDPYQWLWILHRYINRYWQA